MNCYHSRLLLAFRPDELAGDDRAALAAHLSGCPTCASAARNESAADAAVRTALLAVPVPAGLREKLHAGAAARLGAAWRRKTGWWASGMLAASLAAVLLTSAVLHFTRPEFSTTEFSNELDRERYTTEETVGRSGDSPMPSSIGETRNSRSAPPVASA